MVKQVSERSTKAELLAAYKAQTTEIKELKSQKMNVTEVKSERAKIETIKKVDPITVDNVITNIADLQKTINAALSEHGEKIVAKTEEYKNILSAIQIKNDELKELYGIEKEADTLAALIEAQNSTKEQFELSMAEKRAAINQELEDLRKKITEEKALHTSQLKEAQAAAAQERKREMEEYEYTFSRQKQTALDKLEDEIASKKKAWNIQQEIEKKALATSEELLKNREEAVRDIENTIKSYELKIGKLTTDKETSYNEGLEAGKKAEAQRYAIELNSTKRSFEADKKILEAKVETYEQQIGEKNAMIHSLQEKLDNSMAKVSEMAKASFDAVSGRSALENLQEYTKNSANGQSKK